MGASYLVTQIPDVVKDAVTDLLGKTKATKLTSSGIVSLGKALDDMDLLDGWFGALANRIVETRYMIREYVPKTRSIMRSEHEFGSFVQRVYYVDAPDPTDNPVWATPTTSGGSTSYEQVSPYDVEGSIAVQSLVYGGKGSWTLELIIPMKQIKQAFTDRASMDGFIAGLYTYVDNKFKMEEESIVNLAANTGIANAFIAGLRRNLLAEYNAMDDAHTITVAEALRTPAFLKYASMEISRLIKNMGRQVTVFNKMGYETYTSQENLVAEILTQFNKATEVYLEADTYHNDLVKLPNFEEIEFWQGCGSRNFAFEDCSKIHVENEEMDETIDTLEQGGIIAFLHDVEYVASTFSDRDTWELVNPRQKVVVHGEQADKGFAVDNYMNAFVLYLENNGAITISGDSGASLKYTHAYDGIENSITVSNGKVPSATGVTFTKVGATNEYTFTPASNAAFTITVSNAS